MNVAKLQEALDDRNLKQSDLSRLTGIHKSSLSRKMVSGDFTTGEADKIKNALKLSLDEAVDIFFTK